MSRDRSGIAWLTSTNDERGHAASAHSSRRFRQYSATGCPLAVKSSIRDNGRSLTRRDSTPQSGHAASPGESLDDDQDSPLVDTVDLDHAEPVQAEQQRRSVIHARGLVVHAL